MQCMKLYSGTKCVSLRPQSDNLGAEFGDISDILPDDFVMFRACFPRLARPIVRRVGKKEVYISDQTVYHLHLLQFRQVPKFRIEYAVCGVHCIGSSGK